MEGSISAINTGIECSNCRNNCVNYYTGECYRCGYRADYTPKEIFERYNKKDSKEIKCSKCGEKASPRFTYDENVLCPKCKYGEYLGTKEMFEQYDKMVKEPEEIEQSIEEYQRIRGVYKEAIGLFQKMWDAFNDKQINDKRRIVIVKKCVDEWMRGIF